MTDVDLKTAYRHSAFNRVEVLKSAECACFRCLSRFEPTEIRQWIDTGQTAVCPRCDMDAVIGSESGYELAAELLAAMQARWFPQARTA